MLKKRFDYPIESARMALRATARLWRYIAKRRLQTKPMTRWKNDCPCCEWAMHIGFMPCARCPLLNFWGAGRPFNVATSGTIGYELFNNQLSLCEASSVSAYLGWKVVRDCAPECGVRYARRIQWAALRKLYDQYSA